MAVEEAGNRTIYAMRQDQQLQYQLLPLASPLKMDVDEVSLVPLGNGSAGNFMQADGTILPESRSLPAVRAAGAASSSEVVTVPSFPNSTSKTDKAVHGKNEERKPKALQNMQDTGNTSHDTTSVKSNTRKSTPQEAHVSPCSSLYGKRISPGKNAYVVGGHHLFSICVIFMQRMRKYLIIASYIFFLYNCIHIFCVIRHEGKEKHGLQMAFKLDVPVLLSHEKNCRSEKCTQMLIYYTWFKGLVTEAFAERWRRKPTEL